MNLLEYFKEIYENFPDNWNVENALEQFGKGKSNEGTSERQAIKRYYVEPNDKRFRQIFLNYDDNHEVNSIVWFFNKNEYSKLNIGELKKVFGVFKMHNIIYDETTELAFLPSQNNVIKSVRTNIQGWVKIQKDGTMHYRNENQEISVNDNYEVSNLTFSK